MPGLGIEWKICRKCSKMLWAGQATGVHPAGTSPRTLGSPVLALRSRQPLSLSVPVCSPANWRG